MADDKKLKSLENRIQDAQDQSNPPPPPAEDPNRTIGMRVGGEFMAHIMAGILLGWGLDTVFGTAPLMIVVMLLAGFGTGIFRASRVLGGK